MDTNLFQVIVVSLFCYLGWIATPWLGGQPIGWHVFGKPLIAGTIVGLVLGDVKNGMLIGATINALYIGAIAPGGAMSADMGFAGYVGTFIAMKSGVDANQAVALAVPLGLIGTLSWQLFATGNAFIGQIADKHAANGNERGLSMSLLVYPQILAFLLRFIPAFLVLYFGSSVADDIVRILPTWLSDMLSTVGGLLPALGMAVLMKMLIRDKSMIAFFIIGFILIGSLKLPIFVVSLLGLSASMIYLFIDSMIGEKHGE